ncbi:MAG: oxaloacetate-decarboxylating malate dehydrogenase, partial [Planctomycetes bacterium]|nr:oxaloacetate-decarboxylating malate dehydrogenase [Planctomycetota bacterium]
MNDGAHGFRVVRQEPDGRVLLCPVLGEHLLTFPLLNKGTAFTERERDELELRGLLPPRVCTMEEQAARVMENFRRKSDDLERYIHLVALMDRNETLFYRVLLDHLPELLPIVYTPTVGLACRNFGRIFRRARGLYLTPEDRGRIGAILSRWPFPRVRVIVVTDGERILGLGDLGANGMGIPIGKLSLYVAAAGIPPSEVMPVCLDTGTDREEIRLDPHYLGRRAPRLRGAAYDELVEEFMEAASRTFPGVLIQFEDFAQANACRLLDRFRDRYFCFNDDIQGTGAVALAAVLAAERVTGRRLAAERIVIAGAGSAGIGIARMLTAALGESGIPPDRARDRIWLVDSKGLVTSDRPHLSAPKAAFARDQRAMTLDQAVRAAEPTVLIGATGTPDLFSAEMLGRLGDRPLVLPLSNPTDRAECSPERARKAIRGSALVAAGSPFPGTSQCNNVYVFPGVGRGVLSAKTDRVTDAMFLAAARTIAGMTDDALLQQG